MGKVAIEKTLMLLLDTYEVTGTFLDEGVRSLLEESFGSLGRSVIGMAQAIPVPGCFGNRKNSVASRYCDND